MGEERATLSTLQGRTEEELAIILRWLERDIDDDPLLLVAGSLGLCFSELPQEGSH